jgi:hypothetical protein
MKRFFNISLLVVILALVLPVTAFAGTSTCGPLVLGSSCVLSAGDALAGDFAVVGGNAVLEPGSTVEGNVFVLGGNVDAYGTVEGDLAVLGGNVSVGISTVIEGDLYTLGGNVSGSGATVMGERYSDQFQWQGDWGFPGRYSFPSNFNFPTPVPSVAPFVASPTGHIVGYFFKSVLIAALAVLVVMFLPEQTRRAAKAVVDEPWISGGLGLLTGIVAPILFVFFIITICFALVGVLGVMALVVAVVFGWIAVGYEVGARLGKALEREWQPVLAAGIGTFIVALVANGVGFIPCVGWLAPCLVSMLGLGAVLLTRFGSQEYISGGAEPPAAEKKPARKAASKS